VVVEGSSESGGGIKKITTSKLVHSMPKLETRYDVMEETEIEGQHILVKKYFSRTREGGREDGRRKECIECIPALLVWLLLHWIVGENCWFAEIVRIMHCWFSIVFVSVIVVEHVAAEVNCGGHRSSLPSLICSCGTAPFT
jgi:hypothetical protein